MAVQTITFTNKEALSDNPAIDRKNKCTADDLNEIKQVVNNNANEMSNLSSMPVGSIVMWAGDYQHIPTGWMTCGGDAISRTEYSELFAIIGTKFGTGDGSTTFNTPNLKGRVPVGLDGNDSDFNDVGKTGGNKKQSHKYGLTGAGYYRNFGFVEDTDAGLLNYDANNNTSLSVINTNAVSKQGAVNNNIATSQKYVTMNYYTSTAQTSYESIMQPYITFRFIIKVK